MALQELLENAGYSLVINLTDYPYIIKDAHTRARPLCFLPLFLLFKHAFLFSRFALFLCSVSLRKIKGGKRKISLLLVSSLCSLSRMLCGLFCFGACGVGRLPRRRWHCTSLYMRAPTASGYIPIWAFPYRRISITRDGDSSRFAPVRAPMPSSIVYCLLVSNQSTSSHPASLCVRLSRVQKKPTCAPIQCPSTAWNGSPALVQCLPSGLV